MAKRQITTDKIGKPSGHFSQATMIEARGRLVFISGMLAKRADGTIAGVGDIEVQTRQVCENLKAAGGAAHRTLAEVCPGDAFLRHIEQFESLHQAARAEFSAPAPAAAQVYG